MLFDLEKHSEGAAGFGKVATKKERREGEEERGQGKVANNSELLLPKVSIRNRFKTFIFSR